jgi:pimeloyl-ACP methyl ester carboxylesterase
MNAVIPATTTTEVEQGPSFWARLGQALQAGSRQLSQGVSSVAGLIDADLRRDLLQMPLLALTVIGPRYAPIRALPDDGHRPILFLHGLGGHRGNFLPMRAWLGMRGRRRGYAIGMTAGVDLMTLGKELSSLIETILDVNGLPADAQVDIVAHSMGGVVARLALLEVGSLARVHTLVTLGTPHSGTQIARLGGTHRCHDLRPGSPVMAALAAQLPWRGPTQLVCLWSVDDPIMQPAQTAQVDGADNRLLEAHNHTDYLLKVSAWKHILAALGDGRAQYETTR